MTYIVPGFPPLGFRSGLNRWAAEKVMGKRQKRPRLCVAHREGRKPAARDLECTACRRGEIAAAARRMAAR